MSEQKDNIPVIRMSIQAGMGDTRAVTFETYLAATDKAEMICATLDKLNFCIDRSKAIYEIEALELQFTQETNLLNAMRDNLAMIDERIATRRTNNGKRGDNPMTSQEEKARGDCTIQIKERTERLKRLRDDIERKHDIVKAGDINGNSDNHANL